MATSATSIVSFTNPQLRANRQNGTVLNSPIDSSLNQTTDLEKSLVDQQANDRYLELLDLNDPRANELLDYYGTLRNKTLPRRPSILKEAFVDEESIKPSSDNNDGYLVITNDDSIDKSTFTSAVKIDNPIFDQSVSIPGVLNDSLSTSTPVSTSKFAGFRPATLTFRWLPSFLIPGASSTGF